MDGPPPPRRYSRGAYDDDRRGPPPPHYRDDRPPYDHRGPPPPLPPYRGPDRRDDYGYDRGLPPPPLPRRRYDDEGPGGPPPPRGFDRRGGPPDSPDYDARKRRRSLSPGGPPRGGRPSMDYPPPREYRDGPPPGRFHDDYYDRRGPPPRGGPRHSGPPPPPPGGHPPPGAASYGEPFPAPPPPPLRPALEPPLQLPHRVTKAYFSDWFRTTNPTSLADSPDALDDAWKKYNGDFLRRELRSTFDVTRGFGGEWFGEKYGVGEERVRERLERLEKGGRKARVEEWVERAEKGDLDGVSFDFDEELARKPRIQPNAATQAAAVQRSGTSANGASASPEQAKVDLPPAASPSPAPAAAQASVELKASSPEFVVLPARPEVLALQGVPPTVAYKELEAVFAAFPGFVRLALGQPEPQYAFVRKGWAIFASADEAASALETVRAAEAPAPATVPAAEAKEAEAADAEMKAGDAPADAAGAAAAAAAMEDTADAPVAESKPADEPTSPYLLAASTPTPFDLRVPGVLSPLLEAREVRVRATPAALSAPERVAVDLDNALRVVDEAEKRLEGGEAAAAEGRKKGGEVIRGKRAAWEKEVEERKESEGMDAETHKQALAAVTKRTLDLALAYLRDAHDLCYYCCAVCESPEQLTELCPRHVRRCDEVRSERRISNEIAFVQSFDEHVPLLQDTSALDVRDFGALSRDEELYRLSSPHLKQEEEGKFRCKTCNKLFSARKFVEKHIGLKHGELFGDALDEVALFNAYVLDPTRLPPTSFQRENYLPSILNPPPPPPPAGRRPPPLADRLGPPHKRSRRESGRGPRGGDRGDLDREGGGGGGPPAPPPKGAALDPRAQRGATAYADLDGPAGGGDPVVLPY